MRRQMLEENRGRRNATICDRHFGSFLFLLVGTAYVRSEQDKFTVKGKYAMKRGKFAVKGKYAMKE